MEKEERFELYCELINCKYPLCYWRYSNQFILIKTNCTDAHLWQRVFEGSDTLGELRAHYRLDSRPLVLDTMLGTLWGAVCTQDEIYVLGPVMGLEGNLHDMEETLRDMIDSGIKARGEISSLEFRYRLTDALKQLPIVSSIDFSKDLAMLHCCLTGERIGHGEVEFVHRGNSAARPEQNPRAKDRHLTWMAEQALLHMVREGDLDYKKVLDNAASVSTGVPLEAKDPMQKARFSGVTFTALCTRAAIEGGLTPEQAYTVGDFYIQQIEDSLTLTDLMAVNHNMYEDFVARVHTCRVNPKFSPQIQAIRDYIELHLEQPLSLELLAQQAGYSSYYFARKFKQEIGTTVNDYIKYTRVERAKMLLATTDEPISEIAVRLQFCSSSYFAEVFQKVTGLKPQEWRKQKIR